MPSPRRRRGKPRHARPRTPRLPRLPRPCVCRLHDTFSTTTAGASQLLITQPSAHWQPVLGTWGLLLLHGALRTCPHTTPRPAATQTQHAQAAGR